MSTTESRPITSPVAERTQLARELAIVAGLCAFFLFYGLAAFGLVGADEPRYAQIAHEMLERHDWVTPILYGKPWLEKPVLFYWEAMVSYKLFGVSDWAARLPNAFNATLMVFAIYAFIRKFRRGLQLDAAVIAVSAAGIIGFGRAASTDMPLTAFFTISMLAWLAFYLTNQKRWLAGFYISIGLATLAKGPVAPFLAALIIVPFAVIMRDLKLIRRTLWVTGILLFVAVALPWYVAVQSRVPEFFRIFILEHNLARYGSNLYRHHQPFWYYLPVALLALLPWTLLAICGLVNAVKKWMHRDQADQDWHVAAFFALWAVLPIIFFSFSGSKLPGYILPAIPGFVLLTVEWLHRKRTSDERFSTALIIGHSLVASTVLAAALLSQFIIYRVKPGLHAYIVAGAIAGVVFVVSAGMLLIRGPRVLRLVTLIPLVIGIGFVLRIASPAIDNTQSARPVAHEVRKLTNHDLPVAGFGIRRELEYGLAFYLNRPISMYSRAEIPSGRHILVAPKGSEQGIATLLPGRSITPLGEMVPQQLDVFRIESAK